MNSTIITETECNLRVCRIQAVMQERGIHAMLVTSHINILYLTGSIFMGAIYIPTQGCASRFIRRPQTLCSGLNAHAIRKVEQIKDIISLPSGATIALEESEQTYSDILRLQNLFTDCRFVDATSILRHVRRIKTEVEIAQIRQITARHSELMAMLPYLYRNGMTDLEYQYAIEYKMRQMGSIGIFRCFGMDMEIFMGSLLTGNNADAPSPYDFALGGSGTDAFPLGANGSPLCNGQSVMLDMAGNLGLYLSDITRTHAIGKLPTEAYCLHELSREIHRHFMQTAQPGVSCSEIYEQAYRMVQTAQATDYFMGHTRQSQFVGHGVGLQINELPVLTLRSQDILAAGMVIALEPKFVLPGIGGVGVENTYLITEQGVELLTPCDESIIDLTLL